MFRLIGIWLSSWGVYEPATGAGVYIGRRSTGKWFRSS